MSDASIPLASSSDSFIEEIEDGDITSSEIRMAFELLRLLQSAISCFRGLWSMLEANPRASEEPAPQRTPSTSTASDAPGLERTLYHSPSSSGNIVINVQQGGAFQLVLQGSQAATAQG